MKCLSNSLLALPFPLYAFITFLEHKKNNLSSQDLEVTKNFLVFTRTNYDTVSFIQYDKKIKKDKTSNS